MAHRLNASELAEALKLARWDISTRSELSGCHGSRSVLKIEIAKGYGMEKSEIIAGPWMIKRIDSSNWQVFEHREIKENRNKNTKSRAGEVDWVGLPAYYGTLLPAITKAKELNRVRGLDERMDLKSAIKRIDELDREFESAVKKTLKAVG